MLSTDCVDAQVLSGREAMPLQRFEFVQVRMGVDTPIVVYARSEAHAVRACRAAYARISALEQRLSDYRLDSELNLLCQRAVGQWVRVSPELFYVLWRAQKLAHQTGGVFDVTVGPLVRLWREARRTGKLPDAATLEAAKARSGYQLLELNRARRAVRLRVAGMQLDLGGIAKGFACDEALRVLRRYGIRHALIQMGGDIVAGEAPPGEAGWKIALAPATPEDTTEYALLRNGALSTSGSTEQYAEIEGRRYAHIIDPRTGLGLTRLVLARVCARDGITADSLATAAAVLGMPEAKRLERLYKGVQVQVWEADLRQTATRLTPNGKL
ncbi:MAG: FAD:protein FMN transferase [Fimbriimonadales bacterium]|nr:FAD:protein FMN transferase [Fimbriimonadales bacterium]